jgi:ABC-type amino acid transport system permease subunit
VVEFFRAVPVLLMMIYIFFTFGAGEGGIGSYWSVVIALTLYNGAVLAEVFRAGILAVPAGQGEAAYAIGLRKSQVMMQILMPQGVKIMLPSIISQCIVALKDTSLGYVILAPGLTRVGKSIFLEFHNQVQTAIVLAAFYILVNLALTWVATWAQRKFVGDPEPDDALDDRRAVVAHTADPDRHVRVLAGPLLRVGLGDAGDVADGLGGVADVHALGDPPLGARHRRLGEGTHRRLQAVADRDHVHGADVVLHVPALPDRELGVVRSQVDEHRPHGREVGRLEREQAREDPVALRQPGDLAVEGEDRHARQSITHR